MILTYLESISMVNSINMYYQKRKVMNVSMIHHVVRLDIAIIFLSKIYFAIKMRIANEVQKKMQT